MTIYTHKPVTSLSLPIRCLHQLPDAVGVTHAGALRSPCTVLAVVPCFPGIQGSAVSLTVLLGCLPETVFIAVLPCSLLSQHALQAA